MVYNKGLTINVCIFLKNSFKFTILAIKNLTIFVHNDLTSYNQICYNYNKKIFSSQKSWLKVKKI